MIKFSHYTSVAATYKTTIILLDGKRVKLQVSGQGMRKHTRNAIRLVFFFRLRTDLGCERARQILHNNSKLLARRSRNHLSLRHHKQMELRGHQSVDQGGGGARTRHPKGPRGQPTASGVQATSGCQASRKLREPPQNVLLRNFTAMRLQHTRIVL